MDLAHTHTISPEVLLDVHELEDSSAAMTGESDGLDQGQVVLDQQLHLVGDHCSLCQKLEFLNESLDAFKIFVLFLHLAKPN